MFRKKGFTLLELIIVIIIIGILATIALPQYIRATEKGRTAEAKTGLATIRSAQIRYYAQYGNYSASDAALDTDMQEKYYTFDANDGTVDSVIGTAARSTLEQVVGGYNMTINTNGSLGIDPGYEYLL